MIRFDYAIKFYIIYKKAMANHVYTNVHIKFATAENCNDFLEWINYTPNENTTYGEQIELSCNCMLDTLNEDEEMRWDTYNLIVENLIKQGRKNILQEIKYRITDGEDATSVVLDIANRESDNLDGMVWFLKKRLEEYLEEDFFKRFL